MIQPRGSQLRICYDPAFAPQSAVGVPNAVATLTAVLQVTARKHIQPDQNVDKVFDCSGQFLISKRVLTRIARLSVEFDCTVAVLKGFLRNAMGAGAGVNLTMLTQYQFQQQFLTLAVGFADSPAVDVGVLFHSVVVNNIKIIQKARERVKVSMDLVGSGDLTPATGLVWPACVEVVPLYSTDCALSINGVDRMVANGAAGTATQEFSLDYSNNMLDKDDPFTLADIDITRLERADLRTIMYNWKVEGYELDATHLAAIADPRNEWPIVWRVGTVASNITLTSAKAILEGQGDVQGFEGEAGRAVLNLTLEPTLDGATLPIVGVASA